MIISLGNSRKDMDSFNESQIGSAINQTQLGLNFDESSSQYHRFPEYKKKNIISQHASFKNKTNYTVVNELEKGDYFGEIS